MFRPFFAFASTLAAAACLHSIPASAIELCETRFRQLCAAESCYTYASPVIEGVLECDKLNFVITQDSINSPPADPALQCVRTAGGYSCEAWPQGDEISYDWFGDDNAAIATDIINPFRNFGCHAGTISVAVTGPGGGTSIASATLPDCN